MVLGGVDDAQPVPTKCDDCDDETNPANATHWCPKCEAHFCEECVKPHFSKSRLKRHPLLTVEEHNAAPGGAKEGCQLHHKPCDYFCRSCHTVGCAACIITNHKDHVHDTGLLEEMVGPLRIALQQCGGPLGTRCKDLREGMDAVQTTSAALDEHEVAALAAVDWATTEAWQELNTTTTGAKTEVGAGFGRIPCTISSGGRPFRLPLRTRKLRLLHVASPLRMLLQPFLPMPFARTDSSRGVRTRALISVLLLAPD
jgi:hypothetical protein